MGCGCSQPEQNKRDDKTDGSPAVAQRLAALDIKDDAQKPVAALNKVDASRRRTSALNLTKDAPRRRLAITTDFNEADDETEVFVHKVIEKSDEDKQRILYALSENFLFKALEGKLQRDITHAMELFPVSAGTTVITQGEKGDYFYIANSGSYAVRLKGNDAPVATLEYPSLFGELALMYSSPRAATVEATTAGNLWRVDRATFRGILLRSAAARLVRFLRAVPVFQKFSEHALTEMTRSLEYRSFPEGTTITENANRFFIIRNGTVSVQDKNPKRGSEPKKLLMKTFFGDRELLSGQSDHVYVAGSGGCKLLALSPANFEKQLSMLRAPLLDHLKYHTLKGIELLQDITEEQLSEVVDCFHEKTFKKGEYIITQGRAGAEFHILQKGKVKVLVDGKEVAGLGAYTYFGERSLLNDELTAADIVVESDEVSVLSLERAAFNLLLGPLQDIILKQKTLRLLKSVPILQMLSARELEVLAQVLKVQMFESGASILKQGEAGHTFYLIRTGEVSVTKNSEPSKELLRLKKSSFFGEKALLEEEPRAANITAVGRVECYTIERDDFTKHLGNLKDMLAVHAQKMQRVEKEKNIRMEDLQEVSMLGSGAFGLVYLVRHKVTGVTYAMKAINKRYVMKTRTQTQVKREVLFLGEVDSPFVLHLVKTFRDESRVYMLLEPLLGGELFSHLSDTTTFAESRARFYAASILLGLNHMHERGIIYRDLKLENVLLDRKGHVKIVDFGFAKKLKKDEYTYTLCGTPDYLAPEILKGTGHNRGADYWSFGVLVYEMIIGHTPFYSHDDSEICRKILSSSVTFDGKISKEAKDFVRQLLNRDPKTRLGMGKKGSQAIMSHPWFTGFDWMALESGRMKAPFVPDVENDMDVSNFEEVPEDMHVADRVPCADKVLDSVFEDCF
eukprot:CAMPEP_0198203120 /NCGR_PEP_ID=MMETSP1445-20131203/6372_1 /TAXON_ID=36898 /ORGANISM="Pyramimonas sp., Strain CCMP2087" /LENGTH=907 /DNA_ID=CAMNT_0043874371 /DNA_START=201 /DNA_END=2924 /DNA_ORIENTATION=+